MAGPGARDYGDGWAFDDEEGDGVDVEDADEMGIQVGDDEVFVLWIDSHLVGVRKWLLRLRTWIVCRVDDLKKCEGGCGRVQRPCWEAMGIVRDSLKQRAVGACVDERNGNL